MIASYHFEHDDQRIVITTEKGSVLTTDFELDGFWDACMHVTESQGDITSRDLFTVIGSSHEEFHYYCDKYEYKRREGGWSPYLKHDVRRIALEGFLLEHHPHLRKGARIVSDDLSGVSVRTQSRIKLKFDI